MSSSSTHASTEVPSIGATLSVVASTRNRRSAYGQGRVTVDGWRCLTDAATPAGRAGHRDGDARRTRCRRGRAAALPALSNAAGVRARRRTSGRSDPSPGVPGRLAEPAATHGEWASSASRGPAARAGPSYSVRDGARRTRTAGRHELGSECGDRPAAPHAAGCRTSAQR
jgi:hypothetical protein